MRERVVMLYHILQWEGKVEEGQKNFDKASKTLKQEVQRFEVCCSVIQ